MEDFGDDPFAAAAPPSSSVAVGVLDRAAEDAKIKALVESSALVWGDYSHTTFGGGGGGGRKIGGPGIGTGGRKIGGFSMETTKPPQGYICHRCDTPGHWIQHCPTNGDPAFDKKKMKVPTGIPKNMLAIVDKADGSYALPTGEVAVLKPDEDAFDRLFQGISSTTRVAPTFPPELHCPLCKQVMKCAVFTSKCCFSSFCDACIRTYILSSSNTTRKCICGATNVLADDLLPNKTVRDTIKRLLESDTTSSSNNVSSGVTNVQDAASAYCPNKPKIDSPTTTSATFKGGQSAPIVDITHQVQHETANAGAKTGDVSVVKHDDEVVSVVVQESAASHAQDKVCQKLPTAEPVKKKAEKDTTIPVKMQGRAPQEFPPQAYTMPFQQYPSYNPYWGGMQSAGMPGYMPPFNVAMPYMDYAPGCYDAPFGGQGHPMTIAPPPQRGRSTSGTGFSPAPSVSKEESRALNTPSTSKEEPEAQKPYLKRSKHDGGRRNTDCGSVQEKKSNNADIRQPKNVVDPIKNGKNRVEEDIKEVVAKHKSNVFSRLSFPEDTSSMKRKSCDDYDGNGKESTTSNAHHRPLSDVDTPVSKSVIKEENNTASSGLGWKGLIMEEDSSDDDEERHFKRRKRASYEPHPVERQEETKAMTISRDLHRGRHAHRHYREEHAHRHYKQEHAYRYRHSHAPRCCLAT